MADPIFPVHKPWGLAAARPPAPPIEHMAAEGEDESGTRAMPTDGTGAARRVMQPSLIANRRCAQLGLAPDFAEVENPFPCMSEVMDLKKEKTFFETRVIDYQNGGALAWD